MNMWVSAPTYTSAAEMERAYAARRARLMPQAKPVVIEDRVRPKPAPSKPREPADAHVKAYEAHLARMAECPSAPSYVRMRCGILGVRYEEVTDPLNHSYEIVDARRRLIKEVKARFPHMSSKRIALVFGEMHYSAVLRAIKGGDAKRQGIAEEKAAEIRSLHADGVSYRGIADAVGVNYGTVLNHLNPGFRKLRNLRRRKAKAA